jgi:PIN domain nuclease of toxin-antitoxin system
VLHPDPFDRMLIAHSLEEKFPLVTGDSVFERYDVQVIW